MLLPQSSSLLLTHFPLLFFYKKYLKHFVALLKSHVMFGFLTSVTLYLNLLSALCNKIFVVI